MTAKMGRPTDFNASLALRILELAKSGATDAQIAKKVGIALSTLKNWKGAHPDFLAALKDAKDVADNLVEVALFQRATGYRHKAIKFFQHEGAIISETYLEVYAPDTTACIFWLKNRQPERWRDVNRVELAGKLEVGALPTPQEAARILAEDFALQAAKPVVVPPLEAEATTINDQVK